MRLICPNCGAKYEVDDAVIPDQGRDVQCSNCGHTWFQPPAHLDAETAEELGEDLPTPPTDPDSPKASLDPDVADLLREEAAREISARAADADNLETQPDLGIEDADQVAADRSAAARARMARLRGMDDGDAEAAAMAAAAIGASRKELLPDVEEINSSLVATQDREPDTGELELEAELDAIPARNKRGSRFAFRFILILVLLAALAYVFAPQIVQFVPQSEPYLSSYVQWVNGLRDQVDPLISQGVDWIKGLFGGGGEAPAE